VSETTQTGVKGGKLSGGQLSRNNYPRFFAKTTFPGGRFSNFHKNTYYFPGEHTPKNSYFE